MTTTPTVPSPPWFDPKTGNPTEPFRSWITALWRNAGATNSTLSNNVNSGVAAAQATAAAAQATANGAAQQASTVGLGALAFSATCSPAIALGVGWVNITTNTITVTPTGGVAPYTYAWSYVSGDAVTVLSPTSAATQFRSNTTASAVYACTVTDSTGGTPLVAVANVGVSIYNNFGDIEE